MASFDNDDALADLLSDGSNDSFFEEPKVLAKRASLTKTPDKKSISDLFGLDDDKPKQKLQNKDGDWLGLSGSAEEKVKETGIIKGANPEIKAFNPPKLSKKISFDNDDDILNTLGLEKKTGESDMTGRRTETPKKSALLESIFGPPKHDPESFSSFKDILKDSKSAKQKVEKPPPEKTLLDREKGDIVGYAAPEFPREGRRSRNQLSTLDPLGLFSNASKSKDEQPTKSAGLPPAQGEGDYTNATEVLFVGKSKDLTTKSVSNIKDLPDWLGRESPIITHKSDTAIGRGEVKEPIRRNSIPRKEVESEKHIIPQNLEVTESGTSLHLENPMLESLMAQQKLATSHMEYQNTSIALQQQESQLLMALQLKKYEENLGEMQRKQQEVLIKQEQQFNSLLERQFAKQQIMENNMRLQQERINSHIQLLISQPPVSGKIDVGQQEQREEVDELRKSNAEENSRLYEELIATLKQRQHEEIFLLNESYKKQISLMENAMESVESRLKTEITSLSEQFHNTIEHVKNEHVTEIAKYKQKMEDMANSHVHDIKLIRENNNHIVEEIKYEYSTILENMKQLKQTESSVMENAGAYTQKLDSNLEMLDVTSRILSGIQDKVKNDHGVLSMAREESTKAKEEEIRLMRVTLEKSREATDTERAQLMALVRSLEMKLMEQSQNSKEERWALQQATAVLVARSTAFDREVDFTRASLEREKQQLETLKLSTMAEQEKIMLNLTEEKLVIAAEKSRLDTTAKLNQNYDSQRAKAEIDAAVQVAKEATALTDRERENLHKQQSEIESYRRNLQDKERKLALKEGELQEMHRDAINKTEDGEKAVREAKSLETKYNAQLKDIQTQLVSLMNREKKLAEEKISLSKERLALHSNLRQVKKCSLCAADSLKPDEPTYGDVDVEQDFSPRLFAVTDPDILRLRYEISEERSLTSKDVEGSDIKKII